MQLYEKVYKDLYNKIKSNYYKPGDLLLPEKQMEEVYGVSRAPIRQALAKLARNGLIERKPGKGTFVSKSEINDYKVTLGGFGHHFSDEWHDVSCKTKKVEICLSDSELAEKLKIKEKSNVTRTIRIRYLRNEPIFYLKHHSKKINKEGVKAEGDFPSMRHLLIEKFGFQIEYVSETLRAIEADEEVAAHLNIEVGAPVLKIQRISYDQEYEPIEYVEYFVKSEYWQYKVLFSKNALRQ